MSHSPNAAKNKGSLSAAVYPKDIERDAGESRALAVVRDPTPQGPSSGSGSTSRQEGLGTHSHIPDLSASSVPLPTYSQPAYCIRKTTSEPGSETEVVKRE